MRNLISFLFIILFLNGCASYPKLSPDETVQLSKELNFIMSNRVNKKPCPKSITSESNFIWPIKGTISKKPRRDDMGLTIKAYRKQEVKAVKSGIVAFISRSFEGYGQTIIIKHSDGFISFYANNSEILVTENQTVKQGHIISRAGQSGRAVRPQLYFRLFKNGTPINPLNHLPYSP